MRTLIVPLSALLLLVGCALDDEVSRPRPVRPSITEAQPAAPNARATVAARTQQVLPSVPATVPAPKPAPKPDLAKALEGKVLMSPFTLLSPILGTWAWANDAKFLMVLKDDGTVAFGSSVGVFQMADAHTMRLQFTQDNGIPITAPPQEWTTGFFENGTVLLLMRGQQAMAFKRVEVRR